MAKSDFEQRGGGDGFHELNCHRCELAYAVVNPTLDEIEHPVCPSCRFNLPKCEEESNDRN